MSIEKERENPNEEEEIVAQILTGETVYAKLKVKHGKNPTANMECRVMVSIDKIAIVPGLVVDTLNQIYEEAIEKGYLL